MSVINSGEDLGFTPRQRTPQVPIFVINLKRRPDRLSEVGDHLDGLGLSYMVVEAVDGKDLDLITDLSPYLSAGHSACFESHRKIWQWIIDNNLECALILEDDVRLDSRLDWKALLEDLRTQTATQNVGLLQLGYIKYGFLGNLNVWVREKLLRRREQVGVGPRLSFASSSNQLDCVIGDLRDGTHCVFIRKDFALQIYNLNNPPYLPIDVFLETIGRRRPSRETPTLARLVRSIARQTSRSGGNTIDSDI